MIVKIEVLREASIDLGEVIVMSCHEFDKDHLILNIILEGLQSKHDFTRCTSAEYLEYLVRSYPVLQVKCVCVFLSVFKHFHVYKFIL